MTVTTASDSRINTSTSSRTRVVPETVEPKPMTVILPKPRNPTLQAPATGRRANEWQQNNREEQQAISSRAHATQFIADCVSQGSGKKAAKMKVKRARR